jgi:protein-tyrosine phosphatase
MAAAFFAERIAHVPDAVEVSSAGLHTAEIIGTGEPPDEVVEVMASYGIDVSGHRSQAVTPVMLAGADLIVGMSRRHVQEAVLLDPPSWPKAFMLKELVRRGALTGPRRPDQGVRSWIDAAHGDRTRASLAHRSGSDDIPDPYGRRLEKYQETANDLSRLTGDLAGLLWPGRVATTVV